MVMNIEKIGKINNHLVEGISESDFRPFSAIEWSKYGPAGGGNYLTDFKNGDKPRICVTNMWGEEEGVVVIVSGLGAEVLLQGGGVVYSKDKPYSSASEAIADCVKAINGASSAEDLLKYGFENPT
jgi:hypothetical protein